VTTDVVTTVDALRSRLDRARAAGRRVGLVPTMGALHAGHRSLIERARAETDEVVVTIFVNPLQFGDPKDLELYPRPLGHDLGVCRRAGADAVFAPSVAEMYPDGPDAVATTVSVSTVGARWEGASRPGHFDGVATVVAKLFGIAGPCRAYFGEKDFQQLAVVRRLTTDLSLPVTVVGCPTLREPDGLARSSRNVRLRAAERAAAAVLPAALAAGASAVAGGERDPAAVDRAMAAVASGHPLVGLDYAVTVDAAALEPAGRLDPASPARLLIAARVGPVRLIDNADPFAPMVPGAAGSTTTAADADDDAAGGLGTLQLAGSR
jgi:pantoate--beta-alanine ligase